MSGFQPNRRILNWALKRNLFDFTIEYHEDRENIVADCVSRGRDGDPVNSQAEEDLQLRARGRCGRAHIIR